MRLLACSDIHGDLQAFHEILMGHEPFDAVILAGDLTTFGNENDLQRCLLLAEAFGRPILTVLGNMDPAVLQRKLDESPYSINGRGVVVGDAGFVGISGSQLSPLHTPNEVADSELGRRAMAGWGAIKAAKWKILVTHTPPAATKLDRIRSGRHVGSDAVREFIVAHSPDVVVCGHIHESRGVDRLGRSVMVNCGPVHEHSCAIIDVTQRIRVQLIGKDGIVEEMS